MTRWSEQENLFFYITHLHWDHFHGPTLKKIIKICNRNYKFLIPKTPETRLKFDLESVVGKENIFELSHCKKYNLIDDTSVLSFQSGPLLADSILSVSSNEFSVLNINDTKIFDLSMSHLLSLIPKPNYVLRSHSSANDRSCFRNLDGKNRDYNFDKTRLDYSKEFFDVCYKTKAEVAIPFASNMACLHKETFKYNSILNFSDYVVDDFNNLVHEYKNMTCKLLLPTEKLFLENNRQILNNSLRKDLKNKNRNDYLISYQNSLKEMLEKQYVIEDKTKVNTKLIISYFSKIIKSTPIIIRKYLNNNIFIKVISKSETKIFRIDFMKKNIFIIKKIPSARNNVIIHVNAYVINDVCRQSHWNSIGVSKRLEVWMSPKNKRYLIFNFLCNVIEINGFLPLNNILNLRFIFIWLRRYREILDILIYVFRIIFLKNKYFEYKK